MPRSLRLEFENAWYHVMNRGARREEIFKDDECRKMFLEIVGESVRLFKIELHAYCLMDNHYHLLLKTPHANLSRAMRHINGVYTQRFNRKIKKDGSLFRGRYKAIIVDGNSYLLQVSRYIHLNPVEAKIVKRALDYSWSSCSKYLNASKKLVWLRTDEILGMFGNKQSKRRYKNFVESGLDDETKSFYSRDNKPVIFGERKAKEKLLNKLEKNQIRSSLSD
jgi:putative transposase